MLTIFIHRSNIKRYRSAENGACGVKVTMTKFGKTVSRLLLHIFKQYLVHRCNIIKHRSMSIQEHPYITDLCHLEHSQLSELKTAVEFLTFRQQLRHEFFLLNFNFADIPVTKLWFQQYFVTVLSVVHQCVNFLIQTTSSLKPLIGF